MPGQQDDPTAEKAGQTDDQQREAGPGILHDWFPP